MSTIETKKETGVQNKEMSQMHSHEHGHEHGHTHEQGHEHVHTHEQGHGHTHTHEQDHEHTHSHEHNHEHVHAHAHVHDPAEKKKRLARVSKIIGHMEYVKRMIENDEDCSDVLMQISAVRSALDGLGKTIINEHMTHCIVEAIESGDTEAVAEFQEAMQKYL